MTAAGSDPKYSDALATFEPFEPFMLDDAHRDLAGRVLAWSLHCSQAADVTEHAGRTFFASTFGTLCAPRSATREELRISIEFLMIFFQIDDAPSAIMNEIYLPYLEGNGRSESSPAAREFQCYHDSLMSHFDPSRGETVEFREALRDICRAMCIEKSADQQAWTEAELLRIRKVIVGIPAFSACWRAIRRIRFSPAIADALGEHAVLDVTCEIACLVNDIASFDRDAKMAATDAANVDPNLVVFRMRTLGDREAALESAIAWYNSKVEQFHRAEQALLQGEHGRDPALRGYLEILHCAIVGDLATSKHLVPLRYEGSAAALDRLVKLDELG
ncbi:terpene synthase family protein [Nannocystaceae bacterium ST9]